MTTIICRFCKGPGCRFCQQQGALTLNREQYDAWIALYTEGGAKMNSTTEKLQGIRLKLVEKQNAALKRNAGWPVIEAFYEGIALINEALAEKGEIDVKA